MSNQEDLILSQISLLIAHVQAYSDASSQQHIQDAAIDISLILNTLSLLYASYQVSKKSSTRLTLPNVPFRFLALPLEMRLMIYNYLLISPLPGRRIKCTNGHLPAQGLGLSPQILRVNSEIYAEAVGVLYEKDVFQLYFSEKPIPGVWGLKDWHGKLLRGMHGVDKGEDADSADLDRIIKAPDPEVVQAGPVAPGGLLQRLLPFMRNLLQQVHFLQQRGIQGSNQELLEFRPAKIHPHRLRRMHHVEIISSFNGTLSTYGILAEDIQPSPLGENAYMNGLVMNVLEYLIAAPSTVEDRAKTGTSNSSKKTLRLIHKPSNLVWPSPRLTVVEKRKLRLQVRKKFELLQALTRTRRVSVRHVYWLVGSLEAKVDEFEERYILNIAGVETRGRNSLLNQEQRTARICAGRVGIWAD